MIGWLIMLTGLDLAALVLGGRQSIVSMAWIAPLHVVMTVLAIVLCLREVLSKGSMGPTKLLIGSAFGPAGVLLVAIVQPFEWTRRRTRKLERSVAKPGQREVRPLNAITHMRSRTLDDRVSYPEPHQLGSLESTLRFGDRWSRPKALQAVVRSFEPKLSPLVAIALRDQDQTLRALAASASARISYEVGEKYNEMEVKIGQQLGLEETLPVVMLVAGHGLHNILLPESQRLRLSRTSHQYLAVAKGQLPHDRALRTEVSRLHEQTSQAIETYSVSALANKRPAKPCELVC